MNEEDKYIKKKLKEDKLISKNADDVFKNFFKGEIEMENNKKQEYTKEDNAKNKNKKMSNYKKWMSIAACIIMMIGGAQVYATSKGYENVFFMIKTFVTGEQTTIEGKDKILSDRDITISYEKINITENITMQVTSLKIKEEKAKLYLSISEKDLETDENIVPLKYEVYDKNNNKLCSKVSSKGERESSYTEELNLENYKEDTKEINLRVYKANSEIAVKAIIDLESKIITIEGEQEALKKISEIELKEYLGYAVETFERKDIEPGDIVHSGKCLDISNISYSNGIYTVKFTYIYATEEALEQQNINDYDLLEAVVKFRYDETNKISKFEMINYEITEGNKSTVNVGKNENNTNNENDKNEVTLYNISDKAIEYRNGENKGNVKIVTNYKEFNYDLDGNGKEEIIRFEKVKDKEEGHRVTYRTYLNGKEFDETWGAMCSIYIVDLNKKDNAKEVVIYDNGPSDDPTYRIYAIKNGNMEMVEELAGWSNELQIDGNGNIALGNRVTSSITPKVYDKLYYFENGKLTYTKTNIKDIANNWYKISDESGFIIFTENLNNIDKFLEEYSNNTNDSYDEIMKKSGLTRVKENTKFKILEFTENEEAKVQLEDGKIGYIFSHAGHLAD